MRCEQEIRDRASVAARRSASEADVVHGVRGPITARSSGVPGLTSDSSDHGVRRIFRTRDSRQSARDGRAQFASGGGETRITCRSFAFSAGRSSGSEPQRGWPGTTGRSSPAARRCRLERLALFGWASHIRCPHLQLLKRGVFGLGVACSRRAPAWAAAPPSSLAGTGAVVLGRFAVRFGFTSAAGRVGRGCGPRSARLPWRRASACADRAELFTVIWLTLRNTVYIVYTNRCRCCRAV